MTSQPSLTLWRWSQTGETEMRRKSERTCAPGRTPGFQHLHLHEPLGSGEGRPWAPAAHGLSFFLLGPTDEQGSQLGSRDQAWSLLNIFLLETA